MAGLDEHQIVPGIRGWLESPSSEAIASDCLMVSGWAFALGSPIVDVWATGCGAQRPLQYGVRRDDVARVYAGEPNAVNSGFTAYLELDAKPSAPIHLEVWATLGDGRSIRLFKRRIIVAAEGNGSAGRRVGPWGQLQFVARQVIQRPSLLLSARSWLNGLALLKRVWSPQPSQAAQGVSVREALTQATRAFLTRFLEDGSRITFSSSAAPVVSIIIVVWNRADLTLTCLMALTELEVATEVIIVDNASTDETSELLTRIGGVNVVRNTTNLGFTVSANIGARVARGEFLLFLNNDATLLPGSLDHLLETARRSSAIGAVGGKLVFPDGRLQEAGSIIWSDGSCEAYGRGGDPTAPEFNFERQVDFCSAALLLTRRAVFEQLGGFDERYRPAYYEDADYCVRLWRHDFAVVYQPKAVAIHYEFGSAMSPDVSIDLQRTRRPVFVSRHDRWLSSQPSRTDGLLAARSHPHDRPSVICVDDAVPNPRMGAGFPRAAALFYALADLGYLITLYVTGEVHQLPPYESFPAVEVVAGGPTGLRTFLTSRRHHDLVIVSRPHNMQYVKAAVGSDLSALGVPCVYDAEAIYALREIGRRRLMGPAMAEADRRALIDAEVALTRGCTAVLAVSEAERQLLAAAGLQNVFTVGHAIQLRPTPCSHEHRRSILFVGAFSPDSPNEDAVLFFCREVLPALRTLGTCNAPIVIAGARIPDHLKSLGDSAVSWRSDVDDLAPLYDDARVFVAPMRYSAGIPLKVVEAAAEGVPVVCTPLVARQLGWIAGTELLMAESPDEFARAIASLYGDAELWLRLRVAASKRVATDYDSAVFRSALQNVLDVSTRVGTV